MTIRALTFGGVLITNFAAPKVIHTFDGVHVQFDGATRTADGWKNAGISIDMSSTDAMDLVLALISAIDKHADYEAKLIPNLTKRLNKKMEKK